MRLWIVLVSFPPVVTLCVCVWLICGQMMASVCYYFANASQLTSRITFSIKWVFDSFTFEMLSKRKKNQMPGKDQAFYVLSGFTWWRRDVFSSLSQWMAEIKSAGNHTQTVINTVGNFFFTGKKGRCFLPNVLSNTQISLHWDTALIMISPKIPIS